MCAYVCARASLLLGVNVDFAAGQDLDGRVVLDQRVQALRVARVDDAGHIRAVAGVGIELLQRLEHNVNHLRLGLGCDHHIVGRQARLAHVHREPDPPPPPPPQNKLTNLLTSN